MSWSFRRKKEVPPANLVTLDSECPRYFEIRRLTRIARWFGRIGYTAQILSNDAAFDARFSIVTADRSFGEALVRSPEVRDAVQQLHARNFRDVAYQLSGRRLAVRARRWPFGRRDPELDRIGREQLGRIDAEIQRLVATGQFPPRRRLKSWQAQLLLYSVLVAVVAPITLVSALKRSAAHEAEFHALLARSLACSLPLAAVTIVIIAVRLKGTTNAHGRLARDAYLTLCAAIVGIAAGAVGVNRWLDTAPPVVREALVCAVIENRQNKNWIVGVYAWRPERGRYQVVWVPRDMAGSLQPMSSVLRVVTHPGRLGVEWISDVRVLPDWEDIGPR